MASLKYKVILAGPPAVGKTSLLYRFVQDKFAENYALTIGAQFLTKKIQFKEDKAKLLIWDIGGQARFKMIRASFYHGTSGILLLFDLTRKQTFEDMQMWLDEIYYTLGEEIPFILIGNKADLLKEKGRILNPNEAKMFAVSKESKYIETSAKTGENVEDAFAEITRMMARKAGVEIN